MSYVFKKSGEAYILDQKSEMSDTLPGGVYKIEVIPQVGITFKPLTIQKDELIRVPNSKTDEVLQFIKNFTSAETQARYKKCKVTHKTGILFHGVPGTGKSATINMVIDELIAQDAIVFFDAQPELVAAVLPAVRQQNPEKLIAIVYEEFDEWLNDSQATINSFLDGQLSVNNMVVLATTNYISKIPSRIKNRPSRFQLIVEIDKPSKEFRLEWFTKKLTEVGEDARIAEFVDQSEGMVIDQMKDLIVSNLALLIPMPDAVKKLQNMSENAAGMDDAIEYNKWEHLQIEALKQSFALPKGLSVRKLGEVPPEKDND